MRRFQFSLRTLFVVVALGGAILLATFVILGRDPGKDSTPSSSPKTDLAPRADSPPPDSIAEKTPSDGEKKTAASSDAPLPANPPQQEPSATDDAALREMLEIAHHLQDEFPNDPDAMSILGGVRHRRGEISQAAAVWEKVLLLDPRRTDLYDMLAVIALDKEENEKAADLCRAGLAVAPRHAPLRRHLAKARLGSGNIEGAVAELRRAVADAPQDDESHLLLGECYAQLGEFESAKASYESAVKWNPKDQRGYYGLALACARLGLEEPAQTALQQFDERSKAFTKKWRESTSEHVRLQNLLAMTHHDMGTLYVRRKRLPDAEQCFRKARSIDARFVPSRYSLARLLLAVDRPTEAVAPAEELVALEPEQAGYHLILATAYDRSNRLNAAMETVKKAIELEPDNSECRRMMEKLLERK